MRCEDLDRLRTISPHSGSANWPPEAREHLTTCGHCSRLQTILDASEPPEFPEPLLRSIEAAILHGLKPVTPLPSASRIAAALVFCSAAVVAAANWHLGVAGWVARNDLQISIDFSLLIFSILALATTAARQMTPGSVHRFSTPVLIGAPLLALTGAVTFLLGDRPMPTFAAMTLSCWEIGVTCASICAPLFWLVLRRSFSLKPISQGALTGLLAGLAGTMVLEIYCPYLDRSHVSIAHIGAAATAALIGVAIGGIASKIRPRIAQII